MNGRFDPESHRYWITSNGVERPVPSVTQVLADLLPSHHASEWHLQRGRAVHACAALVGRGLVFEHDPRIAGQVDAVSRFYREIQPDVIDIERQVYSERYQFAGTLDLVAGLRYQSVTPRPVIVDFKASLTPATIFQCAAYALAYPRPIHYGVGVELHKDGTYKLSEMWYLQRAQQEWLTLLGAYRIRERLGLTNTEEGDA